jgi:hypothetical protein
MQTDAVEIIKPDPDSHFLLRPCRRCGGADVKYVKYLHPTKGALWRVVCFNCHETLDPGNATARHPVQVLWNRRT